MIEIISCDQNSPEWRKARAGIVTASAFSTVLAKGKSGGSSLTRTTLLYRLAGEIITGEPAETFSNGAMERGHAMEEEARDYYAFITDQEPELVGFVRNGRKGASPDAFLGSDGLLEIKTHKPEILIGMIFKDEFPPEHKAQTQGQLWICEREWVDLQCYWRGMPSFIKRSYRDEAYISQLSGEVDRFNDDLDLIVERLRMHGTSETSNPITVPEQEVVALTTPIVYISYAKKALELANTLEEISALEARMADTVRNNPSIKASIALKKARMCLSPARSHSTARRKMSMVT